MVAAALRAGGGVRHGWKAMKEHRRRMTRTPAPRPLRHELF